MGRSRAAWPGARWSGRRWPRRHGHSVTGLAAALALAIAVSGCGVLSGLGTPGLKTPAIMTLTSSAFTADELIPQRFTCRGAGVSPPLYWTGAPASAKSFAIVIDDSDAPIVPYVYWIVFDIPAPGTSSIAQDSKPPLARVGQNSRGMTGYDPPCPPASGHLYRFTVMALNSQISLPAGTPLRELWPAITSHVIGVGRMTAFARPGP